MRYNMSNTISIFINGPKDIHDCRSSLEGLLGLTFCEEKDEEAIRYIVNCLGTELLLFGDHGFVNDLGIPFEDFSFHLGLTVAQNGLAADIKDNFRLAAGQFLFELIATRFKWNSILVDNFQRIILSFPERGALSKY